MREDLDGGGLVFDADNNKAMTLNKTGVMLWHIFAKGADLPAAVREFDQLFENASPEKIEQDCESFRQELLRRGLFSVD